MSSQKKYYLEMLPYERSDTPKKMVLNLIWIVKNGIHLMKAILY